MIKLRQSQAFVLLVFLLSIVLVGFTLSIMMKPVHDVYQATYNSTYVNESDYQQFYERGQTMWVWLPLVLALGLIFWVFVKAHEKIAGGGQ